MQARQGPRLESIANHIVSSMTFLTFQPSTIDNWHQPMQLESIEWRNIKSLWTLAFSRPLKIQINTSLRFGRVFPLVSLPNQQLYVWMNSKSSQLPRMLTSGEMHGLCRCEEWKTPLLRKRGRLAAFKDSWKFSDIISTVFLGAVIYRPVMSDWI